MVRAVQWFGVAALAGLGVAMGQDDEAAGKKDKGKLPPRDPQAVFARLDADKDGKLSLTEFKKQFENRDNPGEKGPGALREKWLEKLREKGIDPEKLKEKGIDPKQLAEKLKEKGIDPKQLAEKLKEKGIDPEKLRERLLEKGIDPEKLKALREKKGAAGRIDAEKLFLKLDLDKNGYLDFDEWKPWRETMLQDRKK